MNTVTLLTEETPAIATNGNMLKKLRLNISSDGSAQGTKITDADSGELIADISAIKLEIRAGHLGTLAEVTMHLPVAAVSLYNTDSTLVRQNQTSD